MTLNFTTEQKIIIGLCGVTLFSNLYFQIGRRKDKMKTGKNFQIPTFLQGYSKENVTSKQRGLRAATAIDEVSLLDEKDTSQYVEEVEEVVEQVPCPKSECNNEEVSRELTAHEREIIHDKMAGFDRQQMDAALEVIPVELMFNRIGKELQRNRAFAEAIKDALTILE